MEIKPTKKVNKTSFHNYYFYFLVFFSWILTQPLAGLAQEKLNKLVQERAGLHQQWQQSESQKSGIFGNRTKKDMTATNEWMSRIIQKDNQIMAELEMLKDIQTTEISYEKDDYKYIAQKAEADVVTLKRALLNKDEDIAKIKGRQRTYEWTTFIFFITSIALGWLFFRQWQNNKAYS